VCPCYHDYSTYASPIISVLIEREREEKKRKKCWFKSSLSPWTTERNEKERERERKSLLSLSFLLILNDGDLYVLFQIESEAKL
jgi:hypothetical protein